MNGRIYDDYNSILSSYDFYQNYMDGKITKDDYASQMLKNQEEIHEKGIKGWNYDRMLLHSNGENDIKALLESFCRDGGYDINELNKIFSFEKYRSYAKKIKPYYINDTYITAIYPEDEMLMYAASKMAAPSRMFAAGSYFGYWVIWAMEALKEKNGICTLSDVNPAVSEISEKNMAKFGFSENSVCSSNDAEKLLLSSDEKIDLLALDATGAHDDPRPEYRGKRIYSVMLKAALHRLRSGSFIIVHNLERCGDMTELTDILDSISCAKAEMQTYNGLGLYRVK